MTETPAPIVCSYCGPVEDRDSSDFVCDECRDYWNAQQEAEIAAELAAERFYEEGSGFRFNDSREDEWGY